MGIADRHIEYRDNPRKRRFTIGQAGNALVALIVLNIVFFLLILIAKVFYLYTHQGADMSALKFDALKWFALPGELTTLSERPWTLLTFMFSHGGLEGFPLLLMMLSSMLWLYAFGYILQDMSGNRLIFPVYIYGSLAGALFFIVSAYAVPALSPHKATLILFGSGAGCTALAVAVTVLSPGYRIFRNIGTGIPIWTLTVIFLVVNAISAFGNNNATGFAILGGGVAGLLFTLLLQKGRDASLWMINSYHWFTDLFNPDKKSRQPRIKEKVFYETGSRTPYQKTTNITQQRIDEILDKINQKGIHFLTEEEKNILKRASEE